VDEQPYAMFACSHASVDFTLLNAGVGLAACPEGLRVTEIVPNGAAYKSGRICVDDILISIDGHHVCALFAFILYGIIMF